MEGRQSNTCAGSDGKEEIRFFLYLYKWAWPHWEDKTSKGVAVFAAHIRLNTLTTQPHSPNAQYAHTERPYAALVIC